MMKIGLQFFANKAPTEIPTIDVAMVTITPDVGSDTYLITSDSRITVEPQITVTEALQLIVKNRLIAQKGEQRKITGTKITLLDNVFIPELVKILQGGTINYDAVLTTKVIGYTPPDINATTGLGSSFSLKAYSAQYDTTGAITQYECIEYTNCVGSPVSLSSEDGVFRASEYVITSLPDADDPPYTITYVAALPTVA